MAYDVQALSGGGMLIESVVVHFTLFSVQVCVRVCVCELGAAVVV